MNPFFGSWETSQGSSPDDMDKTRSPISSSPILSKGEGVWCIKCLEYGVWNWLIFLEKKKSGTEIYEPCFVCKKREKV